MVFESIVVELINRYLGEFVENLDTSNLKIGIWGGDVVLNNLNLKESALDELELPVKIKAGHIGKLTLKIPWKNLYTEPVVAELDGIYALAVPNIGIKYNEEKERKAAQEAKQAKLAKIEEQKKLEEEKDKPKDPKKDSFAEKLATQVIKNLQIRVTSVHVRYEDAYTNPSQPVSIGVTLGQLLFQTTDENWKETVIKEAVTQIHKLIRLDNLAVYWNSKSEMLQHRDHVDILARLRKMFMEQDSMKANVARQGNKPNLQYLFKPISAVAHLKLNTKPELQQFTIPKIFLSLVFDNIALSLTKQQYDNILEMMESQERMALMALNKKTRPSVPYKGHSKAWWHHAYACILENDVRRRRQMWGWVHMKGHRDRLRQYKELWGKKLRNKKLGWGDADLLEKLELQLDVLNIMMARTQAEGIVAKEGAKKAEEKAQKGGGGGGWFGGWFGGKTTISPAASDMSTAASLGELGKEFQEKFDAQEQAKLYKAIGYEEGVPDTTFPTEFVAVRVVTKLNKLSVALIEDTQQREILMKSTLSEIFVSFGQRPSANAIRVDSKVSRLLVTGRPGDQRDVIPKVVTSVKDEEAALLSVMFETNPLDGECDSRARVKSHPVEIIYHAITINSLAKFFKPPENIRLKRFSEAAMERYSVIKEQTATGMMHAMEEKKYMDIQVDLMASYILLPETGVLKKDVNMLMLNLGSLKISSEKNQTEGLDLTKMSREEVGSLAYDKFNINLSNVQLLFVQPGDTWQDPGRSSISPLYILRPLSISLDLEKCIFSQDPKLPEMRMKGELPLVSVALSDNKLIGMMKLIQSIPLPESSDPLQAPPLPIDDGDGFHDPGDVDLKHLNLRSKSVPFRNNTSEFTNFTAMAMSFQIHRVCLEVFETVDDQEVPLIKLVVARIGAELKKRTFDIVVEAYLGAVYLQHLQYKLNPGIREQLRKCNVSTGELINIINTPKQSDESPLLSINFLQAEKNGPEFATLYKNTAQSVTVQFATLDFIIHQGVILSLMRFAKKFEAPAESMTPKPTRRSSFSSSIASMGVRMEARKRETVMSLPVPVEMIQLKLKGLVEGVRMGLCSEKHVIMDAYVGGIEAGLSMYKSKLGVSAIVRRIDILDPDPLSIHKQIVTVSGSDVLSFNMMQYTDGTAGSAFDDPNNVDLDIGVSLGRAKVTFVNKFVESLLNFLDNFTLAKAKLEEAGKAAREQSLVMAKNIQEHSLRMRLSISLKAPLIVFPRNSKSQEVILINLGDINLKNSFENIHPNKTQSGMAHIVEALSVVLTNLRVSRGISEEGEVSVEIDILEPISFKVNLRRNLSESFFHGIPDLALTAVLETVKLSVSFEDMCLIMLAMDENLQEKAPLSSKPIDDEHTKFLFVQMEEQQDDLPRPTLAVDVKKSNTLDILDEEGYTKMKVDFKMVSLDLNLYKGSSNLGGPKPATTRPSDKHLAQISMSHLNVDFSMMSDEAMKASVVLGDIALDDRRQEKAAGITNMIHPVTRQASQEIINVEFTQNPQLDKVLTVHIFSIHVCLCMEFLMRVSDFFTKAMPPAKPRTIQQAKDSQILNARNTVVGDAASVSTPTSRNQPPTDPRPSTVPPPGTLNLSFKLEKPEIILIEDQMNLQTNSLIVDVGLNFNLRTNEDNDQMITGSVDGFSLISCVYKQKDSGKSVKKVGFRMVPKLHEYVRSLLGNFYPSMKNVVPQLIHVLSPCDITLFCKAPGGKNHHADIKVSDVIINISPSTIRLLSVVTGGMVATTENQVMEKPLEDYSEIWSEKDLNNCSFWFTSLVAGGSSVDEVSSLTNSGITAEDGQARGEEDGEKLMLAAPLLILKLEGGIGHRTVPLLIFESSFSAQVTDWSTQLHVDSAMSVEIAYYNERLGAWEPIIEPVITSVNKDYKKWELGVEVISNGDFVPDEDVEVLPQPKMAINISASDPLQMVVTKTCLDVLNHLGQVFNEAYQRHDMEGAVGERVIPYMFKNQTGMAMKMLMDTSFEVVPESLCKDTSNFLSGDVLSVADKVGKTLTSQKSVIRDTQLHQERKVGFQFQNWDAKFETSIKKAGQGLFMLPVTDPSGDKYRVVCNVDAQIGQKIVSFTSVVKVHNHLECPIEVFYIDAKDAYKSCGIVGNLQSLWLPLAAVYSKKAEIYFQPLGKDEGPAMFKVSEDKLRWKDVGEGAKVKQLSCKPITEGESPFFFNVLPVMEQVPLDQTEQKGPVLTFNLHPTVMLHNLLPCDLKFLLEGTSDMVLLKAGRYTALDHASVNHSTLELVIPDYRGLEWSGRKLVKIDVPPLSVWSFQADDHGKTAFMDLGLHCKMNKGSFDLTVYSPYWIINMSQQDMCLKEDDKDVPFNQGAEDKDIMMFFFKDKPLFGSSKKKADQEKVQLKIGDGTEWSDKFSLDTVGSSGNVVCKHRSGGYNLEVGVKIALSASGLTKIVTLTPFYMMLNASVLPICVKEETVDAWICVEPGECKPFYPVAGAKVKDAKVVARIKDSDVVSAPFLVNKAHTTLLQVTDKYGGLNADCQVRESAMITTFTLYYPGMATVQVVNQTTDCVVSFQQSGVKDKVVELKPMTSMLYTWDDPAGKTELLWSCGLKKNVKGQIEQDGVEMFQAKKGEDMYRVSFLDGMQRVLMFTPEHGLALMAIGAGQFEQADTGIKMGIHDVGLSLVNNEIMVEVAYMGVTSSGVIWEEKKKRYKGMKVKDSLALEHGYQKYLMEKELGKRKTGLASLENKLEVDFEAMEMIKPRAVAIRRSFEDGVWVELKMSAHSKQFHAKINRLQLDNQLRHAVFPTVLSPIPPPKSVAADSVPKPFVEVSLIMNIQDHSNLVQIKYFRVLIQEMNLKVDQGFLNQVLALFDSGVEVNRDNEFADYEKDVGNSKRNLKDEAGLSIQQAQPNFYDSFHISPIKIHLSFSLQGGGSGGTAIQSDVINVFLQSVGVVLTDVQDVVFKLGYFERNHTFYDSTKLTSEFIRHYSGQAIKQMYVLILGLDVLGNPFGLLRGLGEGIEDLFYEPYQGAIQGPEEFAEGLALGVRSLFGHAVGGAAGAVSRITGTVGKGLAALTLDDDYQKKRREQMNKKPASAKEGFARGGKGLVMGVFDGVTGIVRKPVEGAKQEGVSGFFKGMGKGLVGVVTRPTSGVVDFASSSFEGIRRITDMSEDIHRLRPTRRLQKDGIIRPYIREEAEGYYLLGETEKGRFLESDEYLMHVNMKEDGKLVLLVTDKRVMLIKRGEIFGSWDIDWVLTYHEMKATPKKTPKGLEIPLKEEKKKKSLFGGSVVKKDIHIADASVAQLVVDKITQAMHDLNLENGV